MAIDNELDGRLCIEVVKKNTHVYRLSPEDAEKLAVSLANCADDSKYHTPLEHGSEIFESLAAHANDPTNELTPRDAVMIAFQVGRALYHRHNQS